VAIGRSNGDLPLTGSFVLEGPTQELCSDRVLTVPVDVTSLGQVVV
jgi:beta-xylosidase